ncbi:MAG: hypothetical protein ACHQQQ_10085 [Bacteroidota bacterium]
MKPLSSFVIFSVLIPLLVLLSWQCFEIPKSPVAPIWDTQLSVPLLDSLYRVSQAMRNNANVITDSMGYLYKPLPFNFRPADIGSQLKLTPQIGDKNFSHKIGKLEVNLPATFGPTYLSTDLISPPLPSNAPIAAFGPTPLPNSASTVRTQQFEFIHFDSGTLTLRITNTLPIPINFPNGITVRDSTNAVIATFGATGVGPTIDTIVNATSSLSGVTLYNTLTFTGRYYSAGSGGSPVTITDFEGVSLKLGLSNATADSARAKFGINIRQDTSFSTFIVDSLTLVKSVSFNNGKLQLTFNNTIGVPFNIHFTVLDLLDNNTQQPVVYDTVLSSSPLPVIYPIDLKNYTIASSDGSLINSIHFALQLKSIAFDSISVITVHATDSLSGAINAIDTPFQIHMVEGVSAPIPFTVNDTVEIPLGRIPYNFSAESLALSAINLKLLLNSPGHPTDVHAALYGLTQDNVITSSLFIPDADTSHKHRFQPNGDSYSPDSNLVANFISRFLSQKGNRIMIVAKGLVNPWDVYYTIPHSIGTIYDTSHAYASLEVSVPLKAYILNGYLRDTLDVAKNSSTGTLVDPDILTSIKRATVSFYVENTIPFVITLSLKFLGQNMDSVLQIPGPLSPNLQIKGAIDSGGVRIPFKTGPISIQISNSDAQQFNLAKKVVISIELNSARMAVAQFDTTDYVHVRAYTNMVYTVNSDKLKNK